jgi:hypothetical protein
MFPASESRSHLRAGRPWPGVRRRAVGRLAVGAPRRSGPVLIPVGARGVGSASIPARRSKASVRCSRCSST